jgi:hypothetical protein
VLAQRPNWRDIAWQLLCALEAERKKTEITHVVRSQPLGAEELKQISELDMCVDESEMAALEAYFSTREPAERRSP